MSPQHMREALLESAWVTAQISAGLSILLTLAAALLVHLRARRATVLVAAHAASGPMPDFDRVLRLERGRLAAA